MENKNKKQHGLREKNTEHPLYTKFRECGVGFRVGVIDG